MMHLLSRSLLEISSRDERMHVFEALIIYMKKFPDSNWLRAVQFKCNSSAESVTPLQKL